MSQGIGSNPANSASSSQQVIKSEKKMTYEEFMKYLDSKPRPLATRSKDLVSSRPLEIVPPKIIQNKSTNFFSKFMHFFGCGSSNVKKTKEITKKSGSVSGSTPSKQHENLQYSDHMSPPFRFGLDEDSNSKSDSSLSYIKLDEDANSKSDSSLSYIAKDHTYRPSNRPSNQMFTDPSNPAKKRPSESGKSQIAPGGPNKDFSEQFTTNAPSTTINAQLAQNSTALAKRLKRGSFGKKENPKKDFQRNSSLLPQKLSQSTTRSDPSLTSSATMAEQSELWEPFAEDSTKQLYSSDSLDKSKKIEPKTKKGKTQNPKSQNMPATQTAKMANLSSTPRNMSAELLADFNRHLKQNSEQSPAFIPIDTQENKETMTKQQENQGYLETSTPETQDSAQTPRLANLSIQLQNVSAQLLAEFISSEEQHAEESQVVDAMDTQGHNDINNVQQEIQEGALKSISETQDKEQTPIHTSNNTAAAHFALNQQLSDGKVVENYIATSSSIEKVTRSPSHISSTPQFYSAQSSEAGDEAVAEEEVDNGEEI